MIRLLWSALVCLFPITVAVSHCDLACAESGSRKGIPVMLDTDIGTDMDDTWALAFMLRSPELDVKLITTASDDTTVRAKIVAKLLTIAARTDIPIGIGIENKVDPVESEKANGLRITSLAATPALFTRME